MVPNIDDKDNASARDVRFGLLKEKCDRITHYLRQGKHVSGLTKNLQRTVRAQAKSYTWDESSKLLINVIKSTFLREFNRT